MSFDSITNNLRPPKTLDLIIFVAPVVVLYAYIYAWSKYNFWDAEVYARAINDWLAHGDPYTVSQGLIFVYPPVFLYVGGLLAALLQDHWGWYFYLGCHIAATLAMPFVLTQYYFRRPWLSMGFAYVIFIAEPGFSELVTLRGGNAAAVFYLLALVTALPGLRRDRWGWFYLAVLLAGMVKMAFLLLLLLPIFAGKRQWLWSAACGLSTMATYPLQRWLAPATYQGFVSAAYVQVVARADLGHGILGAVANVERKLLHHRVDFLPYLVQTVFIIGIFLALLVIRRRELAKGNEGGWLALLLVAIVLCNPRIQPYDSYIGLFAAFVLLVEALQTPRLILLLSAIFLPSMLFWYIRLRIHHPTNPWGTYETFLLLGAFGAGFWRLWRSNQLAAGTPERGVLAG